MRGMGAPWVKPQYATAAPFAGAGPIQLADERQRAHRPRDGVEARGIEGRTFHVTKTASGLVLFLQLEGQRHVHDDLDGSAVQSGRLEAPLAHRVDRGLREVGMNQA